MELGTRVCLKLHQEVHSKLMVEKNDIQTYRQRQQDYVMDRLKSIDGNKRIGVHREGITRNF